MSHRQIQVTTQQNHNLQLDVFRKVHHFAIRKKFLRTFTGQSETTVVVQYGLGIVGKGTNLKAALNDFYTNWNYFCTNRKSA